MNVTVMYAGQSSPHVGWLAVDEFAELLAHYAGATLVSPQAIHQGLIADRLLGRYRFEPVASGGGDILIVVGRSASDLNMAKSITGYRKKFAKIYGIITDSYHQPAYLDVTSEYDAVFVTAVDDMAFVQNKFKTTVYQMYQGIDTLRWGPSKENQRSVDIVGFGRMPAMYQEQLIKTFHQTESPYLYLHSPLGNVTGTTIGLERGMLFKLLQRSNISLAFNLLVGATGNRPISMMVTSRWLESLLSGCIVAGKRPVSRMADDMLCWEGATIELSDNAEEAVGEIQDVLKNSDAYAQRRMENVFNIYSRHDWRFRMADLSKVCGVEFKRELYEDIDAVRSRSEIWRVEP